MDQDEAQGERRPADEGSTPDAAWAARFRSVQEHGAERARGRGVRLSKVPGLVRDSIATRSPDELSSAQDLLASLPDRERV